MPTGEIMLRDLIAWTDLIYPDASPDGETPSHPLDRDVDWVITARSTPPMLPTLRGGELVLLPERIVNESALNVQMLVQELASQPVAGVVLDTDATVRSTLPILRSERIEADLESDLNRMLTTRRGDLLRTGADIERTITEQRSRHASPETLLRALANQLQLGFVVRTAGGASLISTGTSPKPNDPAWLQQPLNRGHTLLLGPLTPQTQALGRFVLRRIAVAVQDTLDEEASTVQDHSTRTRLLSQALRTALTDPTTASGMLRRAGIPQDTSYRVVLGPRDTPERDIWPLLRTLGTPIDAGILMEYPAWIVQSGQAAPLPRGELSGWVVASDPRVQPESPRDAVRQALFLAQVRERAGISGRVARFDDFATVGVMRLLFDQWGTPLLDTFVDTMLGELIREDRRGQLRSTLRAYLAFGGSQRPTAEHLCIHRNTLSYRLRQVRSLLTVDPDDPDARLNLHLALVASELPAPPSE